MTRIHIKYDDTTTINKLDTAIDSVVRARQNGGGCPSDFVYKDEYMNIITELTNITKDLRTLERLIKSANYAYENSETYVSQNIKNINCFELQNNNNVIK